MTLPAGTIAIVRPVIGSLTIDPLGVALSTTFVFPTLLHFGVVPAAVTHVVAVTISHVRDHKAMRRALFNMGQYVLTVASGWVVLAAFGIRPTLTDLRLTGILYDLSGRRPVAILRDIAGGQWRVTTGMTLGRMRVAQIKPKTIIFTIEEFGFNRQDSLILGDTTRVRPR